MIYWSKIATILVLATIASACSSSAPNADAYGTFEATEVIVSSESAGAVTAVFFREGEIVSAGSLLAGIDGTQLSLEKRQALAARDAVSAQIEMAAVEVELAAVRLNQGKSDLARIKRLAAADAAPKDRVESLETAVQIAQRTLQASKGKTKVLKSELETAGARISAIDDRLLRTTIRSPLAATILARYVESGEIVGYGRPMFKLADLRTMKLRVYVSEPTLPEIKLGQTVTVRYDTKNGYEGLPGKIEWISSQAEFTPKIIQTAEERVNLVYAVNVSVRNDGRLKIGMPGEVMLQ